MLQQKVKKVTVRFPRRLKSEMQEHIIHLGYGLHGKSRWLSEAIEHFVTVSDYIELVENGMHVNQSELLDVEAFYLKEDIIDKIKQALINVRVKYPMMEGVQSAFIRSAVVYKLMLTGAFLPGRKRA